MLLMWYISFVNVVKKLMFWAGKGVKRREEEWMDIAKVVWSEVAVLCVFWDGSCERRVCGAGMLIKVFTPAFGMGHNSQKSADLCPVRIPSTPKWEAVPC